MIISTLSSARVHVVPLRSTMRRACALSIALMNTLLLLVNYANEKATIRGEQLEADVLIKAIEQSSELEEINESIRAQQELQVEKERLAKRRAKNVGITALVLAGATLIPAVGSFVSNISIVNIYQNICN